MPNNISNDLKLAAVLKAGLRAFKRRIIGLQAFSTRFNNFELEGTNKLAVPYYPLHTTASNDYVDANGYVFDHDSDTQSRLVTIDRRKYQPFKYYSHELNRQPAFNQEQLIVQKAEQLAIDVWLDVLGLVTEANFPTIGRVEVPEAFEVDDVIDIGGQCDEVDFPEMGRSLVLNTDYSTNLKRDPGLKDAAAAGSSATLREGDIGRVDRFDVYSCPRVPENAEDLGGLACMPSAILCAFSPIKPGPGVGKRLLSYAIARDETSGITLEYRHWGDCDADEEREVIESNYGRLPGESAALVRLLPAP